MPREISTDLENAYKAGLVFPCLMASLTFKSSTQHVWTGAGDLVWNGTTFKGVGTLGKIGSVSEQIEIQANGTSVTLSGIDPALFADSMNDIKVGADAALYIGALTHTGQLIGEPYTLFRGQVDKPSVQVGADTISITLALETRMSQMQRASSRRYTSADQNIEYPNDSAFDWVETGNDQPLDWGG